MSLTLKQKVVWITGTTRGIGRALALGFAKRGAIIVATGSSVNANGLEDLLKKDSPESIYCKQDVTDKERAIQIAEDIKNEFGRLDVVINNAGIDPRHTIEDMSEEEWNSVIGTNLNGSWNTTQSAISLMKQAQYGKMIQVGSISAHANFKNLTHYMSSKMALEGMTRGLARDLGPYGIRCNCLVLGAVKVEKEDNFGAPEEIEKFVNANQCIPGRILPEDVESVFAFFASNESDAITGQSIHVDLGWTYG